MTGGAMGALQCRYVTARNKSTPAERARSREVVQRSRSHGGAVIDAALSAAEERATRRDQRRGSAADGRIPGDDAVCAGEHAVAREREHGVTADQQARTARQLHVVGAGVWITVLAQELTGDGRLAGDVALAAGVNHPLETRV